MYCTSPYEIDYTNNYCKKNSYSIDELKKEVWKYWESIWLSTKWLNYLILENGEKYEITIGYSVWVYWSYENKNNIDLKNQILIKDTNWNYYLSEKWYNKTKYIEEVYNNKIDINKLKQTVSKYYNYTDVIDSVSTSMLTVNENWNSKFLIYKYNWWNWNPYVIYLNTDWTFVNSYLNSFRTEEELKKIYDSINLSEQIMYEKYEDWKIVYWLSATWIME